MTIDFVFSVFLLFVTFYLWLVFFRLNVKSWYSPFVFVSILTFNIFFVRPFLLVFGLDVPYPDYLFTDLYSDIARAQIYVVLWLFFLVLFSLVYRNKKNLFAERIFPEVPACISMNRLRVVVVFLSVATLLLAIKNYGRFGSYSDILIAAKLDKEMSGTTIIRQLPGLAMLVSAVYVCEAISRKNILDVIVSVVSIAISIATYYMWGAREAVAIVFLGFVLLLSMKNDGRSINWVSVLVGFFVLLGVSTYVYIDRLASLGASEKAIDSRDLITTVCISFHMTRYDAFMLQARDWDYYLDLRYGYDIFIGNMSVIPRFIWPDKPEQILPGAWFRQIYEPYAINGWPFSVIGEWMISFWCFGLFIGAFFSVYLYKALDNRYSGSRSYFGYFLTIFVCMTVIQNGSILQLIPEYILWVVPMFLVGVFISKDGGGIRVVSK